MADELGAIDAALIGLLRRRIEVLAKAGRPALRDQFRDAESLLNQNQIPHSLWRNLLTACLAALRGSAGNTKSSRPRRIAIVGGAGMMGRFFARTFSSTGHQIEILDRDDWSGARELLEAAEMAIVCVPIEHVTAVIADVARRLSPQAVLADITSIKKPAMETMLANHTGPVVGLHPMFGPSVESLLSQKVVVCHGRQPEAYRWLLDLIESQGGHLVESTAEEHDRMMIYVQAVLHFCTIGLGTYLMGAGVPIGRSLELASPIYRLEIDMVGRLFAQAAPLYADIMLATEDRRNAIQDLSATFARLAQIVRAGDREALIQAFETTRLALGGEAQRALEESGQVVSALSTLLAAHDAERIIGR